MTKHRYLDSGCAARSQVRGDAWSSDHAWIVNFNNGNVNNNNRNNNAFVRAVRGGVPAGEYQGAATVSLEQIHAAWRRARRQKVPSHSQAALDSRWIDRLIELQAEINAGSWRPRPSTCFVATRPKAREIHAPHFADRVVHHWLVPQLERLFDPGFIHDSFANRVGKGSHAAVRRLQAFVRQVDAGQGGGYFLQLDVHNFFNSIPRATLYTMLKRRMERAQLPEPTRRAVHALLRRSPTDQGVTYRATAAERMAVPAHKRLENAPPGCGLPIGNLSSQFFANVYLDALDQFVKHSLKVPRYLRYVDDFVLVHHDRGQLLTWKDQIEQFLARDLGLSLKDDVRLLPLADGIDFLGYVVRPTHTLVRRRVVGHARAALSDWQRLHVRTEGARVTPAAYRRLGSIWASYQGHFAHAASHRLVRDFHHRFPWLHSLTAQRSFDVALEGRALSIPARTNSVRAQA